jgi:hypothetical protein
MFTLCRFTFPISRYTLTAGYDERQQTKQTEKGVKKNMTNDELQVPEAEAGAAAEVISGEVEVVAAMAVEIVDDSAVPNEAEIVEIEALELEAEGEEEE